MAAEILWSIKTSQHDWSYEQLSEAWREAETLGFYGGFLFDHYVSLTSDAAAPCLDGWILLSALLRETQRLRGGLLVAANTFRHPAVLANMATAVDVL